MADNTTLNSGSGGDVIATDDIGGVKYQRMKVTGGADGVATDIGVGGGTEATALRVTLASDSTGLLSVDDNGASLTVDNPALSVTGGGVEASALRVTLASDSTGVMSIDDNGGSITVDNGGTFAVQVSSQVPGTGATNLGKAEDAAHASGDTGVMALTVRSNTAAATSGTDGDYQPLITDTNGRLHVLDANSASALTALQLIDNLVLAEDAAHVSGDPGLMALAVRRDANTTMVSADGDYSPLQVDSAGSLKVAIISGAGSGGTSSTDDAAFTAASGSGTPMMGFVTSDSVDSGDVGVVGMTATRSIKTVVTNSSGTVIDPQVDDAAFTPASGMVSVIAGIVTADTVDSGDAGAIAMTTGRAMHTAVQSMAAGSNLIGDVGISGARTSGGTTPYYNLDVDETEDAVKASAGQLFWIHAINLAASKRYLKFYNATVASVTVGTTTPVLVFPLPTQGDTNGAGFVFSVPNGIAFSTAITVAATTGFADNDTGAPGANEVIVNIGYA